MRVLIACDKFKGSLSAATAAEAIAEGLRSGSPIPLEIEVLPIADGGDGLAETLYAASGGTWVEREVRGPLGEAVTAAYLRLGDGRTAVVEMARASGLVLLEGHPKDPWRASTHGTGELIAHALESGAEEILLGIGGSATNDGGVGMAEALGFRFEGAGGRRIDSLPEALEEVVRVVPPSLLRKVRVTVACDVTNPLLGPDGCTRIYGPQKGIGPGDFARHEARLAVLVALFGERGRIAAAQPGAGAAGGLGFGALLFLDATLVPGFDLVAGRIGLAAAVERADLVITGEGRLDRQSLQGKGPHGVATLARSKGKATAAFCGSLEDRDLEADFGTIAEIRDSRLSLKENMARAGDLLRGAAANFARSDRLLLK